MDKEQGNLIWKGKFSYFLNVMGMIAIGCGVGLIILLVLRGAFPGSILLIFLSSCAVILGFFLAARKRLKIYENGLVPNTPPYSAILKWHRYFIPFVKIEKIMVYKLPNGHFLDIRLYQKNERFSRVSIGDSEEEVLRCKDRNNCLGERTRVKEACCVYGQN